MESKSTLENELAAAGLTDASVRAITDKLNANADEFAYELHARLFARPWWLKKGRKP